MVEAGQQVQLNLGCGRNKIPGYINIDTEESTSPDFVFDFSQKTLPYDAESVDKIVMFHCIEHIQKGKHLQILKGFSKVLKPGGELILSYPDFWKCANNWKENKRGLRDFWHATLFGRQLYPADYHVCAMDPSELRQMLETVGFERVTSVAEYPEEHNTITRAFKSGDPEIQDYEGLVADHHEPVRIK